MTRSAFSVPGVIAMKTGRSVWSRSFAGFVFVVVSYALMLLLTHFSDGLLAIMAGKTLVSPSWRTAVERFVGGP